MVYTDGTHLVADTLDELHEFAQRLGLKRQWFQDKKHKHYDLLCMKKELAVQKGALLVSSKEIVQISNKINSGGF